MNSEMAYFTLLFCRERNGHVHKSVPHVQHDYFSTLDQSNSLFMSLPFPFSSLMLKSLMLETRRFMIGREQSPFPINENPPDQIPGPLLTVPSGGPDF